MVGHYTTETIANWAADYSNDDAVRLFTPGVQQVAVEVLTTLLRTACQARDCELSSLTEADIKTALLVQVAALALPEAVQAFVPSLCRAFLEDLQKRGRLGNGRSLGRFAGALKIAYMEAVRPTPATFERPGAKIGRNDACPCGSGKKFKKCCGHS